MHRNLLSTRSTCTIYDYKEVVGVSGSIHITCHLSVRSVSHSLR